MPLPLLDCLEEIKKELSRGRRLLLGLDFDGTLVPLRDQPEECVLDVNVRQMLTELSAQKQVTVAIVSGRELADVRERVGVAGLIYSGNHGIEIDVPGMSFVEPKAVQLSELVASLVQALVLALAQIPGAWVQNKTLTASVHFRKVAAETMPLVIETVHRVCNDAISAQLIELRHGKMVLEVRPVVTMNKGTALRWILNRVAPLENRLVIYFGDDATDEDAFTEFRDGVTVAVCERPITAARYLVNSHVDVHDFLAWLLEACSMSSTGN